MDAAVGFALADEAVKWARYHDIELGEVFETYRPTGDELFRVLAREAVCSYAMAKDEIGPLPGADRPSLFFDLERELLMLKAYQGELLIEADKPELRTFSPIVDLLQESLRFRQELSGI